MLINNKMKNITLSIAIYFYISILISLILMIFDAVDSCYQRTAMQFILFLIYGFLISIPSLITVLYDSYKKGLVAALIIVGGFIIYGLTTCREYVCAFIPIMGVIVFPFSAWIIPYISQVIKTIHNAFKKKWITWTFLIVIIAILTLILRTKLLECVLGKF